MSKFNQITKFYDPANQSNVNSFYEKITLGQSLKQKMVDGHRTVVLQSINCQPDTPYLLSFRMAKNCVGSFEVQLSDPVDTSLSSQVIYSFTKNYKQEAPINIVFVPYSNFKEFLWTKIHSPLATNNITDIKLYRIKPLQGLPTYKNITKLGIQARPFTYFLINKEPIRVGRNGIYELEGININSIYAAPLAKDNFIIDYRYED